MSPFLAQVQVISVADTPANSARTDPTPAASTPTEESIRALAMEVKAGALAKAQKELEQAKAQLAAGTPSNSYAKENRREKSPHSDNTAVAAVPIVAIVFTFLWLIVRALMAPFTNRGRRGAPSPAVMEGLSAEEADLLEKLQRTLAQMESRVESLETILIDQARTNTKEKYGTKL